MLIFSPNCLAGFVYRDIKKIQYNHPFVWMLFNPDDYIDFIENFENINFDDIEFNPNNLKLKKFEITISNKYTLQLGHFHYSKNHKNPTIIGNDVYYCKIWEYVYENYIKRLERMKNALKNNEEKVFLFYEPNLKCNRIGELPKIAKTKKYRIFVFTNKEIEENEFCKVYKVDDKWPLQPGAWHDGFMKKYNTLLKGI